MERTRVDVTERDIERDTILLKLQDTPAFPALTRATVLTPLQRSRASLTLCPVSVIFTLSFYTRCESLHAGTTLEGRHTNPHAETRAIVLLSVSGRIKPTLVSRRILSAVARSPLVLPLAGWALGASVVNLHATSQKGKSSCPKRKGRGRVVGYGH